MTDATDAIRHIIEKSIKKTEATFKAYIPNSGGYLSPGQVRKLEQARKHLMSARELVGSL